MDGDSVGGVPSPAITPLVLPPRDSSSSPAQPETHSSPPPTTPVAAVVDADFVTPTQRSGRYGAAADGATVTDEDSMHRAMRRKAELNLDYSGNLQMYMHSPSMVTASLHGGPRSLFGGLYTPGGYGERHVFVAWMVA
jgi:hypothetical protein